MKVTIEIELEADYSSIHFTDEQMKDILFEYPKRITEQINALTGTLRFNGMALGSVHAKSGKITSYSIK